MKKNNIFKIIFINIKWLLLILFMYFLRIFPIKNNRILVVSYTGKEYGDNGKYIVEELLKGKTDYEIFWTLCNINAELPSGIKKVKYKSLNYLYVLATSKIWVNNCRFPCWVRKRKEQTYFQVWHGSLPVKKIEFDTIETLEYKYIKDAINDNKMIDYMVSNSDYCTNTICRGAFQYNNKIIDKGTPRNDILLEENRKLIERTKKQFGISKDEKVILYAPTFRNVYQNQYDINFDKLIQTLTTRFGGHWKVLLRLHPNVRDRVKEYNINFSGKILDACFYPDMQELILSSDLIVTDYSSLMFDGLTANKPVVLYTNDFDYYVSKEREMYFDFNKLPFLRAQSNEELNGIFKRYSLEDMKKGYEKFKKIVGLKETGESCKEICSIIEGIIRGETNEKNN